MQQIAAMQIRGTGKKGLQLMRYIKIWIKAICFLLGLVIIVSGVQQVFGVTDYRIYQTVQGFYAEPDGSLDAVYIGASNVYAYWQAPIAWAEYGYTVYPWSVPSMPASAIKYIIEDAQRTQPDALYIINLNDFKAINHKVPYLHYLVDYMPMSTVKIKLIRDLAERCGITGFDQIEFFLPLIRFHSGWSELTSTSFSHPLNHLKAAVSYNSFLSTSTDVTDSYRKIERTDELAEEQNDILEDLLSYCEANSVRVLFMIVPQATTNETQLAQLNMVADIAESRGFDVLDLERSIDEIGLDLTTDYYNARHLNAHGSLKYTSYLGKYLSENFDFEDKRGNPSYASWDAAYEMYREILAPYALDFELSHARRDNSLAEPVLSTLAAAGQSFALTWEKTSGADGYLIYRKSKDHNSGKLSAWKCIADVDGTTTSYADEELTLYDEYWYTVVPVKIEDGSITYGKFNIAGISDTIS